MVWLTTVAGLANASGQEAVRVLYAEPLTLIAADSGSAQSPAKPGDAETLSFVAYGRRFDLDLQPNARLLNALDARQKKALAGYSVLRGAVRGAPDSWVRLVRRGATLRGAFWDGNELYSISPASDVAAFVDAPLAARAGALAIYRLSDAVVDGTQTACGVRGATNEVPGKGGALGEYSKLVAELRLNATFLADRQIEVAFIGDGEFSARHTDAQAAALSRINIIDGIYAEQVGVMISAPVLRIFQAAAGDPFDSFDPGSALDEISAYRAATADVRQRGLAHLFTGKELIGGVAGVAFIGALCDAQQGVGVAESFHPELLSALISVHEIGHNFNAPHDGEDGSPCAGTSQSFIMAPVVTFNTTFSQCSLNQMYHEMEAAACILPANSPDAQMGTEGLVTAPVGQAFDVAFDVASVGTADIDDARITIPVPADLQFVSAAVAGGSCIFGGGIVSCNVGALPVGNSAGGVLRLQALTTGTRDIEMNVDASGDRRTANDTDTVRIDAGTGADISLGVAPARIDVQTEQSFAFSAIVASIGTTAVDNVSVQMPLGALIIEDLQSPGGSCTGPPTIICTFGTLGPGEVRRIDIRASSAIAHDRTIGIVAQPGNDANPANASRNLRLVVTSAVDVMVEANALDGDDRTIGETFEVEFTVASIGERAANDVVATFNVPQGFVVQSATANGTSCPVNGTQIQCALATMPSRSARRVLIRGRGIVETGPGFAGSVTASDDDNPANNFDSVSILIRPSVDVAINNAFPPQAFQGRPFDLNVSFSNRGVNTATGASLTASLPASFAILEASPTSAGGSCSINGSTVNCTFASLPRNTGGSVSFRLRPNQLGTFTGTFTVDAPGDDTPANNAMQINVNVAADVDIMVGGVSQLAAGIVGVPIELPVTVRTGLSPVSGATLTLISHFTSGLAFLSIDPQANCSLVATTLTCALGSLPAQSTIVFTLRVRFPSVGRFDSLFQVNAPADTQTNNNTANFVIDMAQAADVALAMVSAPATVLVGDEFEARARLTVQGANEVRNLRIPATRPAGIVLTATLQGCTRLEQDGTCGFDSLAGGATQVIGYNFRATVAGTYTITLQAEASNDTNSQNDMVQFTVVANPAPPPPPPPPPPSQGGGGGGGGSLGGMALAFLLAVLALRRRTRDGWRVA